MYQPELGVFLSKDPWSGDVLRPGSMNRWGYVEGNPINSSDPSGLITDKEALEADRIRNYLLYTYDVIIQKDWGCLFSLGLEGQPILTTIKSSLCCEGWYAGNWRSIRELEQTRDAIDLVATQMRNPPYKFRSAMQGTVTISRVPGAGVTYRAWVPPPPLSWVLGDIVLTDYTFDYGDKFTLHSTIHELGHVWDVRTGLRLSRGIFTQFWTERCSISYWDGGVACSWVLDENIEAPPGNPQHPYAGFSSMEDWAEAFATYVYPYYYEAPFNPLRSLRRQYVDNQIKAIP